MSSSEQDLRGQRDAELDDTLWGEVGASFRGKQRGLIILVWIFTFAFFLVAIWAGFRFVGTEHLRGLVAYAALFLFASMAMGFLKTWYWGQLDRNAILRRIERLEVALASKEGARRQDS